MQCRSILTGTILLWKLRDYTRIICARYKEIDQGVIEHGPAVILVIAEVYGWEAPLEIGEGDIRDPAGFRGHPTDLDVECLGVIKPENTVKHIHKMLKLYKQHKAGK